MFSINKQPSPPPPPPPPEPNGIKIELTLSEATLIKLASIAIPVLFGAGVWVVQSSPSSRVAPVDVVEVAPDNAL